MAWNAKCPNGGPDPFDPNAAVASADFNNCVYVNTATVRGTNDKTRYAYTYVNVTDGNGRNWRVCVVGHAHFDAAANRWVPGNTFIPGWNDWEISTSAANTAIIAALQDFGTFPGDARYPA